MQANVQAKRALKAKILNHRESLVQVLDIYDIKKKKASLNASLPKQSVVPLPYDCIPFVL